MALTFPFSAIVGQDEMKLAILIAAVDAGIGGVLVFGDRGTGKSTAVRALAALLPPMRAVVGCPYHRDPALEPAGAPKPKTHLIPVPVVDLPLGATEDRVVGALDLERALSQGVKAFEPGLLARANRGFLYIDEVNLLEDHLVDLLIDVAASGENVVEREACLDAAADRRLVLFLKFGDLHPDVFQPRLVMGNDQFQLARHVVACPGGGDRERRQIGKSKRHDALPDTRQVRREPRVCLPRVEQVFQIATDRLEHLLETEAAACIGAGRGGVDQAIKNRRHQSLVGINHRRHGVNLTGRI